MRGTNVEGVLPGSIEVDGVGEDQPCEFVDGALRYQIIYPVFRLVGLPSR